MDIALQLFSTSIPEIALAGRTATVADAWELDAERVSAVIEFEAFRDEHGETLWVRAVIDGNDPMTLSYSKLRAPFA